MLVRELVAIATVATLTGCSFGMRSVPRDYDGTTDPACDSEIAPIVVDGVTTGILMGVGAAAADQSLKAKRNGDPNEAADAIAVGGLVGGLVFAISAAIGEHTRSECREAKTAWRLSNALRREAE